MSSPSSSKLLISTFNIQLPFQYTCELFLLLPESKSCLVCDIPLCLTNTHTVLKKIQLRDKKKMLQVITGIFRHYYIDHRKFPGRKKVFKTNSLLLFKLAGISSQPVFWILSRPLSICSLRFAFIRITEAGAISL